MERRTEWYGDVEEKEWLVCEGRVCAAACVGAVQVLECAYSSKGHAMCKIWRKDGRQVCAAGCGETGHACRRAQRTMPAVACQQERAMP